MQRMKSEEGASGFAVLISELAETGRSDNYTGLKIRSTTKKIFRSGKLGSVRKGLLLKCSRSAQGSSCVLSVI